MDDIETLVQGRIDGDTGFQATLANLSDEEKNTAIASKRSELTKVVFKEVADEKANAEKIAKDQRIRAEKAEGDLEKYKPKPAGSEEKDLSTADLYALQESKVPFDDVEEVKRISKVLGKTIPETLKEDMTQTILKDRQEKRASAEAANRQGGRPANEKKSGAQLQEEMNKGNIPEKGSADADDLFWARRGGRRS